MNNLQSLYDSLKEQGQNEGSFETGIDLEKWRELGENGVAIPMKIHLNGFSMMPLIRAEKDIVTIIPLVRKPMVGDIVLFRRTDGKNIVHRVYKVLPDEIQTWGDNCQKADAPTRSEDIYGLVISVEKDGKTYQLDTDKQRAYGIRWMKCGRSVWMALQKVKSIGSKIIRRIFPVLFRGRGAF